MRSKLDWGKSLGRMFVPIFEEYGMLMPGVLLFFISQFSAIEQTVSTKNLLLIEDIDFLSSNVKRYFTSGLNYARFEEFYS